MFAVLVVRDLRPYQLSKSGNGSATLNRKDRVCVYLVLRGLYRRRYEVEIVNIARSYSITTR
jgi:hypothetical protein